MPEVIGTIRVMHHWGRGVGAAAPAAAGGLIGAGAGAGSGVMLAGPGAGPSHLAGVRAGAFMQPGYPGRAPAPVGMDPATAAAAFRNNQRALREWKAGATYQKAWRVRQSGLGHYMRSRGGFLDWGLKRRMERVGWDFKRFHGPQVASHMKDLAREAGRSILGRRGLEGLQSTEGVTEGLYGAKVKEGVRKLTEIGKAFKGVGASKLAGIGKFFKTLSQRTGLSGGALGGMVRQVATIGPAAAIIYAATKALGDLARARTSAGGFQQRLAAAEGLGTGHAASQLLTQQRQARYDVEVAGRGTYAGERGLLQERMIRDRLRRQPGYIAQEWAEFGADLSLGATRFKSWFYKRPDPVIEKARRAHNRRWVAGEVPQSWQAMRDELKLREDPYYRALEEAKELRPDLFGGSKRGFIPVSGQYGLAGATATATATQLSKEDLQNERDRIIYSIQESQGMGP